MSALDPKLQNSDPVGWYLCEVSGVKYVFHWDGYNLCDQLPHKRHTPSSDPGWNRLIDRFWGPMCFVDIEFPGDDEEAALNGP